MFKLIEKLHLDKYVNSYLILAIDLFVSVGVIFNSFAYTGLRLGEKLYEEVLSNAENTDPTSHDRIRVAHVREYNHTDAMAIVDKLEELSSAVEIESMVRLMKESVPEFISKNSRFEKFDKQVS